MGRSWRPPMRSSRASRRLGDDALRAKTAELKAALHRVAGPRRAVARGVCARSRGGAAHARDAPLRRAADRRHRAAPRQDRRDAHGRGQDARRHAQRLPERADGQGRARRHRQRVPRAARRGLDGPDLPVPRAHGRRHQEQPADRREARRPTPRTSPTARTTSSGSTICATTSRFAPRIASSAP